MPPREPSGRDADPGRDEPGQETHEDEPAGGSLPLVPRYRHQGYGEADVERRRRWVEETTGCRLDHVGSCSVSTTEMRGSVENPVGTAQVPLGVAGPLLVRGEHARGSFYVPLATTEGSLVRSYERGMIAITRSGGAAVRIDVDENRVSPAFACTDVEAAADLVGWMTDRFDAIRRRAEATTRHGRLLRLRPRAVGRDVIVDFCYTTGDAAGMNMIVAATDRAARWIVEHSVAESFHIFSGSASEKRAGGTLMSGGKGKRVVAGASIRGPVLSAVLNTSASRLHRMWQQTVVGHLEAAVIGYNGHYANGLAALFIACGQDVANVANSAVGITNLELDEGGDIHASVTLPSLSVATVGGGTHKGTARECLEMIGCLGTDRARKLAEIAAATLLAGELSMGAAIASGELAAAHQSLGRNPPPERGER